MIKWVRIEAGEYKDEKDRFHIIKTWNRVYGNHWQLYDNQEENYYRGIYPEKTLLDCKLKAEAIVGKEA